MFTSSIKCEIRQFDIVVAQWRQSEKCRLWNRDARTKSWSFCDFLAAVAVVVVSLMVPYDWWAGHDVCIR